jgi:hypothetical protein
MYHHDPQHTGRFGPSCVVCDNQPTSVTIVSPPYCGRYNLTEYFEIYDQGNNLVASGTIDPNSSAQFSLSETLGETYTMNYFDYPLYIDGGQVSWTASTDTLVLAYGNTSSDGMIPTQTGLPICGQCQCQCQ